LNEQIKNRHSILFGLESLRLAPRNDLVSIKCAQVRSLYTYAIPREQNTAWA
jgi:hypothetical protein